jgi:tetratricopeptide (TPR) repeat protein
MIAIIGIGVYFDGLKNQFLGDDALQIVNNPVVHSISHVRLLFEGGTFYLDRGMVPLSGVYYRPLMTACFSLIYTLFGAQPFYFHIFQLIICIGSSIILYLFFCYSFRPAIALFLALLFLIDPLNSQIVFEIANLQDALYFFFGILALYILIRFASLRSLAGACGCLLLSLLAKETAILFIMICLLYLYWWNRKRLLPFILIMIVPITIWLVLKIHAVGFNSNPGNSPIDRLSLGSRFMNDPQIVLFYISKLIFPWRLASGYYWIHSNFSLRYFLLPLVLELLLLAGLVYIGYLLRKAGKTDYYTYLFFAAWTSVGLLLTLQIIPLDLTVSESWFYFPSAGVFGMIGAVWIGLSASKYIRIDLRIIALFAVAVLLLIGLRTAIRGRDWRSEHIIAIHDVIASPSDFNADNTLADQLIQQGNFKLAAIYTKRSIAINPAASSYLDLGVISYDQGNYAAAENAYEHSLYYIRYESTYENLGLLTLFYGTPTNNVRLLNEGLEQYPHDASLWMYLAILYQRINNRSGAVNAIHTAALYGQVPNFIYEGITENVPFKINSAI